MWKMYSDDMKGVCIKMRSHPFVEHEIDAQDIGNNRLFAGGRIGESGKIKSLVLLEELYNSNYMFYLRDNSRLLYKVEYNDLTYLEQFKQSSILEKFDNGIISLNGNLLGKVKNNFWKFQQEWRYILLIYPLDPDAMNDKERYLNELNRIQKLEDLHSEGKPLTDYFLTLKDEALETMEIQLGPKTNDIDEEIVSLLLKKYNPTAADNISKSDLQGRV